MPGQEDQPKRTQPTKGRAIKGCGLTEKERVAVRAEVMQLSLHLGKFTFCFQTYKISAPFMNVMSSVKDGT